MEVVFQDFHSFVQPEFHVFSTNSLVNALKIKFLVFITVLFKFLSLRYLEDFAIWTFGLRRDTFRSSDGCQRSLALDDLSRLINIVSA